MTGFSTLAGTSAGATQAITTAVLEDDPIAADETGYITLDWHKGRRGSLALGGYGRHLSVKSSRLFAGLAGTRVDQSDKLLMCPHTFLFGRSLALDGVSVARNCIC